jgi:hypothetical protein
MEPRFAVTEARLIDAWNAADGEYRAPGEGELGFTIAWSAIGVGFGETTFYMGRDGVMHCDNECMSRDFFALVLAKFLEGVEMDHST